MSGSAFHRLRNSSYRRREAWRCLPQSITCGSVESAFGSAGPSAATRNRGWHRERRNRGSPSIHTTLLANVFGGGALFDPDLVELCRRMAHERILSFRIRRTEGRPMWRRRAMADLLRPERRYARASPRRAQGADGAPWCFHGEIGLRQSCSRFYIHGSKISMYVSGSASARNPTLA